ncbi:uncharacterized protein LOC107776888 isoform X3 [Nicotiana tabacum]|uniref:Uncharacterized protein LOC107776888 isoform X3 n=2 Tax=Nicotiana tabacum TaxID=4097 RepID=A0AC58U0J2_TOBAC
MTPLRRKKILNCPQHEKIEKFKVFKPDSSPLQGQLPQPPVHTSQTPMMGSDWQDTASHFDGLDDSFGGLGSTQNSFGIATSGFDRLGSSFGGLSSGAKLDERLTHVEERLEKIEAHSKKAEALLTDINKKLNYYPVKIRYVKVSRDIRCSAKYMSCHFRPKRKHRVAEMIRQSCKHRRLRRGVVEVVFRLVRMMIVPTMTKGS